MVKKIRKFNYQKNLKKEWKKKKAKKNPAVNADQLKPFWDSKKTILANYREMGIAADPNVTLEIPRTKALLNPEVMNLVKVRNHLNLFKILNKIHM
jgi:hypothetical protein